MTTTAVVYTFLFIHIGVILVVASYYTFGASLAPQMTERGRIRFARRPWLPIVIGTLVSVPWVVIALVALNMPSGAVKFAGAALGSLWILSGLLGGASIAQHIGRVDGQSPTWSQTFRGGLLIVLTWILPIVGWLVMLPMTLCAGVGCLLLGILPMRSQPSMPGADVPTIAAPVAA